MPAREVIVFGRFIQLDAFIDSRQGELGSIDTATLQGNIDFTTRDHLRADAQLGQCAPRQAPDTELQPLKISGRFNFLVEPASGFSGNDDARQELDVMFVVGFLNDFLATAFPDPLGKHIGRWPKRQRANQLSYWNKATPITHPIIDRGASPTADGTEHAQR